MGGSKKEKIVLVHDDVTKGLGQHVTSVILLSRVRLCGKQHSDCVESNTLAGYCSRFFTRR